MKTIVLFLSMSGLATIHIFFLYNKFIQTFFVYKYIPGIQKKNHTWTNRKLMSSTTHAVMKNSPQHFIYATAFQKIWHKIEMTSVAEF